MSSIVYRLYSASTVASYFLKLAESNGQLITHMRLQKLVFFSHAWSLAIRSYPLLDEDVQAWETGLVIPSIYGEYISFGRRKITSFLYRPKRLVLLQADRVVVDLLNTVWEVYSAYTDLKLLEMTHLRNSPWKQARSRSLKPKSTVPDEVIKEYYKNQLKRTPAMHSK